MRRLDMQAPCLCIGSSVHRKERRGELITLIHRCLILRNKLVTLACDFYTHI